MPTARMKIGFFLVTEDFNNQAFDVTLLDKRTGKSLNFEGLPLMDYDDLLRALRLDPSIDCVNRLVEQLLSGDSK